MNALPFSQHRIRRATDLPEVTDGADAGLLCQRRNRFSIDFLSIFYRFYLDLPPGTGVKQTDGGAYLRGTTWYVAGGTWHVFAA
jgi:hypothetical protein